MTGRVRLYARSNSGSVGLYARNDLGSVGLYARNDLGSVGACPRKPHYNGVKITPIKGYTTITLRLRT